MANLLILISFQTDSMILPYRIKEVALINSQASRGRNGKTRVTMQIMVASYCQAKYQVIRAIGTNTGIE